MTPAPTPPSPAPDTASVEARAAAVLTKALLLGRFGRDYDDIMAGPSGPAWWDPHGDFYQKALRLAAALAAAELLAGDGA